MITPFVYRCRMVGWYDGDSPTVDIDLGFNHWMLQQKIRLYGVDTPELRGQEREQGLEVRDLVRKWVPPGSDCIIRTHKDRTGKFGRWLGEIFLPDQIESVNARLVAQGLAQIEAYTASERRHIEQLLGVSQ